jgi:hypothetical protein
MFLNPKPVTPAKVLRQAQDQELAEWPESITLRKDWIPLRLPVLKISLYNWPLRVVSLSNHDFYPPLVD